MMTTGVVQQSVAIWLAALGLWYAAPAEGAEGPPTIVDVALNEGGVLYGRLVDAQGRAVADATVSLFAGDRRIAVGRTHARGTFAFGGLRGGVYRIAADRGQGIFRVWNAGASPPNARQAALLVAGSRAVRGQGLTMGPLVGTGAALSTVVATMVATPIALNNTNQGLAEPMSP